MCVGGFNNEGGDGGRGLSGREGREVPNTCPLPLKARNEDNAKQRKCPCPQRQEKAGKHYWLALLSGLDL